MSNINKAAVLIPFSDLTAKEHSDRLTAIDAHVSSTLATQKSEVAAAIAQVNLTQSQTITALSLEVSNLKTDLTNSITATQTDLINRADDLAQDVTDITQQLTQDKATFTQEIQDALDYLQDEASLASALRTPRKIQGVDFDGTQDISLPTFSTQIDGLVPKRVGATTTNYLREDGTWAVPPDTTYALLTKASAEEGTATTANTISAQVLKEAIQYHAPTVTNIVGNAATTTKLQTPRSIAISGAVTGTATSFDGSSNITIATTAIDGSQISTGTIPAARIPTLNQSTTGNAESATKLQTARLINGIAFDGTGDINLDVYSKAETVNIAGTPDATETVAGKAKIATTAIAQAGVNDTDIITSKKLRDALNASGNAPISACRAWVCFNGKASPPEILSSLNISSVVKNATGDYTLNFTTPLGNSNYAVSCGGATGLSGSKYYPCVKAVVNGGAPVLKTPTQLGIACVATSTSASLVDMSEIYIEVFC